MYDLLYGVSRHRDAIQAAFPTANIEDASDDIHQDRISIDVDMEEEDYWKCALRARLYHASLSLQVTAIDKETFPRLKAIVEGLKAERDDAHS